MILYKSNNWKVVFVSWCQEFVGDCIISCNKESLSELTNDEWLELGKLEKELERVTKKLFGATMFNFACLMNNAYRDNEKPHVHFHFVPRYKNELKIFNKVYKDRHYAFSKEGKVSIKTISKNKVAFCSEKAGMAHNMFKFLGIDSELVCGARNKEMHAYNFIFPNGYGSEPIILYDPSNFVSFIKDNKKISLGFYKALRKEEYELLKSGEVMKIDLTTTERNYRNLYDLNGFEFVNEDSIYVYGFENAKNYVESINR